MNKVTRVRRMVIAALSLLGVVFVVGAVATELLGLDLTPGFGVLQTLAFLVGLTSLTIAAYLFMAGRRPPDAPRSLQADIGVRLSLTGLVFCYVTGFADLIRIGTHIQPEFERPFIGPLQLGGFVVGLLILLAGMVLYYTSRGKRPSSSMEFILNGKK
jgi:drug/metabolite transporter (DMT)-like permease